MKYFRSLITGQSGLLLTEYAVMVVLLSVAMISAFSFFSGNPQRPLMDKGQAVMGGASKNEIDQTVVSSEDILPKNFYAIPDKDTK